MSKMPDPSLAAVHNTLALLPDPVLLLGAELRIGYRNPACQALLARHGVSAALLGIGRDCLADFVAAFPGPEADRLNLAAGLAAALGGTGQDLEYTYGPVAEEWRLKVRLIGHALADEPGVLVILTEATEQARAAQALHESQQCFWQLANMSSDGVVLSERGTIIECNTAMSAMLGYDREELIGMAVMQVVAPESRATVKAHLAASDQTPYETSCLRKDGSLAPVRAYGRLLPYKGRTVRCTTMRDLTAIKQAERALRQSIAQEEKIRAQAETLAELSTPLIPLSDEIMVMPLIGTVDPQRAQRVLETLLDGIADRKPRIAILDITGVSTVDSAVADALVRAARAVRLLGAQVVLTGLRAEVAQTLVGLQSDLSGIITCGNLQSGIDYARTHRR